jgi:hypothetical protein
MACVPLCVRGIAITTAFPDPSSLPARLQAALAAGPAAAHAPVTSLNALVQAGLAALPLPGSGHTLQRWQALAAVAAHDLALVKLYEGHTDALAILAELGVAADAFQADGGAPATWGTWAAEAPGLRVLQHEDGQGGLRLQGTKAWCSGAAGLSHALLTTWGADGSGPYLAAVALQQPGVSRSASSWQAVGMAHSGSIDVHFDAVPARPVGVVRGYLQRPGFWQGGAGIAACWHGAASALAAALHGALRRSADAPWHRLLALGAVDTALSASAALLRETAAWIDAHPRADAQAAALRVRTAVEGAAELTLQQVGRALGATPFCRDAAFAARAADLPVFLRQGHGERDLVALGECTAGSPDLPWRL